MVDTLMRDVSAPKSKSGWLRQLRRAAMLPFLGAVAMAGLFLTGCTTTEQSRNSSSSSESRGYVGSGGVTADAATTPQSTGRPAPALKRSASASVVAEPSPSPDRAGLGTSWGETRESRIGYTQFVRGSNSPASVSSLYYNSEAAIRDLVGTESAQHGFIYTNSGVEWRVQAGGALPWWRNGGRLYVAGREGQRYTLVVRNTNSYRVEVVLTVDGLDVMDGKTGSFNKRGYIVEAGDTLKVDGFRQSTEAVAAFRFSSIGASYANQRHGDTRNVGVIGMAVYTPKRVYYGDIANPFPDSRYAQPPRHPLTR